MVVLAACQSSAAVGAPCARTSECTAPLVCRLGRCRTECASARDCGALGACIQDGSYGVCRLEVETHCASDGDCGGSLRCAGGVCRNHCRDASDCIAGGDCVPDAVLGAVCVEPTDERDAGATDSGAVDAGPGDAGPGEIVIAIATDADDGQIAGPLLFPTGEGFQDYAGAYTAGPQRVYLRFALPVALTAASAIAEAHLELWGTELYDSGGVCLPTWRNGIVGEDVADAAVVTSADQWPGGPTGASPTTATVAWPFVGSWAIQAMNRSPDIAPILREVVDHHGGLAPGAHVQLWWWAENFVAECAAGSEDYANVGSHPAELHVRIVR